MGESLGLNWRKSWFKWEKNLVPLAKFITWQVKASENEVKGYSGSPGQKKIPELNK